MDKKMQTWSTAVIQGGIQINNMLKREGKSWADVEAYLADVQSASRALQEIVRARKLRPKIPAPPTKVCPSCNKQMRLMPTDRDDYQSKWLCASGCGSCNNGGGCGYVEFNELSIEEIIKQGEFQ